MLSVIICLSCATKQAVAKPTSAADASGFSVLGRPRFLRSSSLFSDKESPARFRLRVVLVDVVLRSIVCAVVGRPGTATIDFDREKELAFFVRLLLRAHNERVNLLVEWYL